MALLLLSSLQFEVIEVYFKVTSDCCVRCVLDANINHWNRSTPNDMLIICVISTMWASVPSHYSSSDIINIV